MKMQRGYLLLIAAFLIVVSSFVVIGIVNQVTNSANIVSRSLDTSQAFYIADAGLAKAIYPLTATDFSDRIDCSAITGDSDFTTVALSEGEFSVTGTLTTVSSSTLSSAITSSSSIIPVSSLSGYVNAGRILINGEAIAYTSTSSDSSSCGGSAPCFLGITRGTVGTTASSHSSGSTIIQSRCAVTATGAVPSLSSLTGKRIVSQDVFDLTQGWIAGNLASGSDNLMQFTGGTWTRYGPYSAIPDVHYYGMHMLNYSNGWIVGQKDSGDATLLQWDGSSWTRVTPAASVPNNDLLDVECIASDDCWAVGDAETFIHWDGSSWTNGSKASSIPNKQFNAVSCTATDNCWATGQSHGGNAMFAQWNGTQWARVYPDSSVPNTTLDDLTCVDANDCWAVGSGRTFVQWDGSTWSNVNPDASVPNKQIKSVSCVASNDCWAVGAPISSESLIVHWDGTSWSRVYPDAGVPGSHLETVSCINTDECWASGGNGTLIYWDGTAWYDSGISGIPNQSINAIHIVGSRDTSSPLVANWKEN